MTQQTSIQAYHEIEREGLLSPLRFKVYSALYKHGPCTANELVKLMAGDGTKTKSRDYFAQRLSELRDQGVVEEVTKRHCGVTGRLAIVWECTDRLPIKLDRPIRHKCPTCNGCGYISEQQTRLF